jgi:hypothetical protein
MCRPARDQKVLILFELEMGSQQAQTHGQFGKPAGLAGLFVVPTKERRRKKGGEARDCRSISKKCTQDFGPQIRKFEPDVRDLFGGGINRKGKEQKMNVLKALWRLGLCTLFVIGFSCGLANASEPAASEKALHEIQESQEEAKPELQHEMKGEAQEKAQEMKSGCEEEAPETQQDVEHKMHETKGE